MAQPPKKRELADFFQPYVRERFFAKKVIPQKRPSPPPSQQDGADDANHAIQRRRSISPKPKASDPPSTPKAPTYSPFNTPRSGSLPFRTPQSSRTTAAPASTYKSGRLFTARSKSPKNVSERTLDTSLATTPAAVSAIATASASTTSRQNVVREGKVVAVRDSDEDDSDSLASLSDLLGRTKDDGETSSSSPADNEAATLEAERASLLKMWTNGRSETIIAKDRLREIQAMKKPQAMRKYMADQIEHARSVESIRETREKYELTLDSLDESATSTDVLTSFQTVLGHTEENAEKLLGAIRRTDALAKDVVFSFFRSEERIENERGTAEAIDFPAHAIPRELFRSYDQDARTRAFLSGFMADLAAQGGLHERALDWCFRTLPTEEDRALQYTYLQCLGSGAPTWARVNVTAPDVQFCFDKLGAQTSSISLNTPIAARDQRHYSAPSVRTIDSLLVVLEMFQRVCPHMGFEALSVLVSMLCRLSLDQFLMNNVRVATRTEALFHDLLGGTLDSEAAAHVASHTVADMTANLNEPTLQALLLERIVPANRLQRSVRITLAHAFLLGVGPGSSPYEAELEAKVDLRALRTLLETSDDYATARLRTKLDYGHLRARAGILDVAISDGNRPASFPSGPFTSAKQFDRRIDNLAHALRNVVTAISDTGATHMKRTEAKEKLDCVHSRLLYVVRTEPPPKKHIFDQVTGRLGPGGEVRAVRRGREVMQNFLAKIKEEQTEGNVKAERL